MRRQVSSKSGTCTESMAVDAAGISVKVGAHYPGRSADLPCATGIARCRDGLVEVSRGHSRLTRPSRRPEHELQTGALISMTTQTLTNRAEMRDAAGGERRTESANGRRQCVKWHGKEGALLCGNVRI